MSGFEQSQWTHQRSHPDYFSLAGQPLTTGENTGPWPQTAFSNSSKANMSSTNIFPTVDSHDNSGKLGCDDQLFFHILSQATEEQLMRAQNPAYMAIFSNFNKLQGQVDSQNGFIQSLLHSRATIPFTSGPSAHQEVQDGFVVPSPPTSCVQADYDDVKYWFKSQWKRHKKDFDERGKDYDRFDYITDEDGQTVGDERITTMSAKARELFNTLYRYRQDPTTWGLWTTEASAFFSNSMRNEFSEFRWCDSDWKVQAFATEKYPDWVKDVRNARRLTRAKPSIQTATKRKADHEDFMEHSRKDKRKKKKIQNLGLPENVDIIDLDLNNNNNPTTVRHGPTGPTPNMDATASPVIPPIEQSASNSTEGGQPGITLSTQQSQVPKDGLRDLPLCAGDERQAIPNRTAASTFPQSAGITSVTPSAFSATNTASGSVSGEMAQTATPNRAPTSGGVSPPVVNSANAAVPPLPLSSASSQDISTNAVLPRRESDMFGDLSIPKPPTEVPQTIISPNDQPTSKPTKKGKPMEPGKTLTTRNLFAIDFLKDHPATTIAEFKKVFDNLDEETKKKYEELAKQKKTEEAQAKKTRTTLSTVNTT